MSEPNVERAPGRQKGSQRSSSAPAARAANERAADHTSITRLADELLPALIAKLAAGPLGELEVREDAWRIRLRRPVDGAAGAGRRPGPERRARGSSGSASPDAVRPATGPEVQRPGGRGAATTNGSTPPGLAPVGPGFSAGPGPVDDGSVALSPAVGFYRPRPDLRAGRRVRAGDVLGSVDMLGIPQEVVAPADGVVGENLAKAGDAVEYGQSIVRIDVQSHDDGGGGMTGPAEVG